MSQPTPLTDVHALARHRARADLSVLFLQEAARDEVEDRLMMVNKSFSSVGIVAAFPELWRGRQRDAQVVPEQETFPLAQAAHDLVIHSLGLHWANDPVGQLIQCRRALRADGLLLAVALGGQTLHELRACLAEAEVMETGGLSPARARTATRPGILKRAAEIYATSFPGDTGGIRASFELIVLTGWAPDASQQKPLRPGSAQARLADALNTDETSLPD